MSLLGYSRLIPGSMKNPFLLVFQGAPTLPHTFHFFGNKTPYV